MKKPKDMRLHTICLFLFILASFCWARRIIVPDSFPTIHSALAESDVGDTVYVRNGIYKENITLADNVPLLGENKEKTIIKGDRRWPVVVGADGAIIKNFTITNGSVGILCGFTSPIIAGNIIRNNRNAGIHAVLSLPEIAGNEIQNNGQFGIFLNYVQGCKTSIHANTITGHSHSGIYCYNHTDVLMVQNTFVRNRHYGVFARDSCNSRIFENTFSQNKFPFNQLAICDNNNRLVESPDDPARKVERKDTLHSYFGVAGACHSFDRKGIHIPADRDYLNSYFFRRHSEKMLERRCMIAIYEPHDGIRSYKQKKYWDAAVSFGKVLSLFPNYSFNAKALYVLANSFIKLGLLQCATKTLNFGLANFPTSSYVVLYDLAFLKIAFLEENPEKFDHYYALLQNYCLTEDVRNECNRIKKYSEDFKNNGKDTLTQQTAMPDSNNKDLTEFESLLFTGIMSKPTPKRIESLKEYQAQYTEKYRTLFERLYSSKIAKLDFDLNSESAFW